MKIGDLHLLFSILQVFQKLRKGPESCAKVKRGNLHPPTNLLKYTFWILNGYDGACVQSRKQTALTYVYKSSSGAQSLLHAFCSAINFSSKYLMVDICITRTSSCKQKMERYAIYDFCPLNPTCQCLGKQFTVYRPRKAPLEMFKREAISIGKNALLKWINEDNCSNDKDEDTFTGRWDRSSMYYYFGAANRTRG